LAQGPRGLGRRRSHHHRLERQAAALAAGNPRRTRRGSMSRAGLQRAQEVEDVLLGPLAEVVEVADDAVRLGAVARVLADGALEVRGAPVVQEEDPLAETPQRRGAEFPRTRLALAYAVGQTVAHVVHQEVGEQVDGLLAKRRDR